MILFDSLNSSRLVSLLGWVTGRRTLSVAFFLSVFFGVLAEFAGLGLFYPVMEYLRTGGVMPDNRLMNSIGTIYQFLQLPISLASLLVGAVIAMILAYGLMTLRNVLGARLKMAARRDIATQVFDHLIDARYEYFATQNTGELTNVIAVEASNLGNCVQALLKLFANIVLVILYMVLLLYVSSTLFWIAVGIALVKRLAFRSFGTRAERYSHDMLSAGSNLLSSLGNAFRGYYLMKAFSNESHHRTNFHQLAARQERVQNNLIANAELQKFVDNSLTPIALAIIIFTAYRFLGMELSLIVIFLVGVRRVATAISEANNMQHELMANIACLDRVNEILHTQADIRQPDGDTPFTRFTDAIECRDLRFRYHTGDTDILAGVSLRINRGEHIALVGPSGGGKSTLLNILLGLLEPQEGQILIDGVDLRDFQSATWHRHIGVVTQEAVVFNQSVRDNICYGLNHQIDDQQIETAARHAQAHDFIASLPQGYDTLLGENGMKLSGGQRQRLTLARAFLRDPDILFMDEPTSAMDSVTEGQIQKALDQLAANRTTITIAHRLGTIRNCDRIYVFQDGQIVAQGTHEELLDNDQSDVYRSFYQLQAQ